MHFLIEILSQIKYQWACEKNTETSHPACSPRSGMLNCILRKISLVCTLGNSNITIRHCNFKCALMWKRVYEMLMMPSLPSPGCWMSTLRSRWRRSSRCVQSPDRPCSSQPPWLTRYAPPISVLKKGVSNIPLPLSYIGLSFLICTYIKLYEFRRAGRKLTLFGENPGCTLASSPPPPPACSIYLFIYYLFISNIYTG